jgi:hypothetical protein
MKIKLNCAITYSYQTECINTGMPTVFISLSSDNKQFTCSEDVIADIIINSTKNIFNSNDGLYHPQTGQQILLNFVGDNVLQNQDQITEIINAIDKRVDFVGYPIQINTNKLIPITYSLKKFIYFSVHPFTFVYNTDLKPEIDMDIINNYADNSETGAIVIEHDGTDMIWKKLDEITDDLVDVVDMNRNWALWIKPTAPETSVIEESLFRGFNVWM